MGIPLFSTMAAAALGGMVWMGATVLEARDRADDRLSTRGSAGVASRTSAFTSDLAAKRRMEAAVQACMMDRQRMMARAFAGASGKRSNSRMARRMRKMAQKRVREPASCKRLQRMAMKERRRMGRRAR